MTKTLCVVYRLSREEADNAFVDILERLRIDDIHISYTSDKRRIDIGDYMRIIFCSGEIYKMAGIRCDFYDAWFPGVEDMLSRGGAIKIDIFEFVDSLYKEYKQSKNNSLQNPSVRP